MQVSSSRKNRASPTSNKKTPFDIIAVFGKFLKYFLFFIIIQIFVKNLFLLFHSNTNKYNHF